MEYDLHYGCTFRVTKYHKRIDGIFYGAESEIVIGVSDVYGMLKLIRDAKGDKTDDTTFQYFEELFTPTNEKATILANFVRYIIANELELQAFGYMQGAWHAFQWSAVDNPFRTYIFNDSPGYDCYE